MSRCLSFPPRRPRTPSPCSSDNASLHTYLESDEYMVQYDSYLKFERARKREKWQKGKETFYFKPEGMTERGVSLEIEDSTDSDGSYDDTFHSEPTQESTFHTSYDSDSQATTHLDSDQYCISQSTPDPEAPAQANPLSSDKISPIYGSTSNRLEVNLQRTQAKRKLDMDLTLKEKVPKRANADEGKKEPLCICNQLVCQCEQSAIL